MPVVLRSGKIAGHCRWGYWPAEIISLDFLSLSDHEHMSVSALYFYSLYGRICVIPYS
jgi:hypothetical protein